MSFFKFEKKTIIAVCISLSIISLLGAIFTHAYIGLFSRYLADDYCTSGALKLYGFFQAQINRHITWDGRYSSTFLFSLFDLFGSKFAAILPGLSICLFLLAAFYFFRQILRTWLGQNGLLICLFLSSMFTFIILYTIPNIGQDVYWMTGNSTYFFPIILELFILGLAIKLSSSIDKHPLFLRIIYSILLSLLSAINSGFSEVSTTLHLSIISILFLIALFKVIVWKSHQKSLPYWGALFLGAFLGFLFMITAPGNGIRELTYPLHPGIIELAIQTFLLSEKFFVRWFLNYSNIIWPSSILLFIFGLCVPSSSLLHSKINSKNLARLFLVYLIFTLLLVVFSFLPSYWALSQPPPERVLILPASVLSMFIILTSFIFGLVIKDRYIVHQSNSSLLNWELILICFYFAASVSRYQARNFYNNYSSTASEFAEKWDIRNASIINEIDQGQKFITTNMIAVNIMGLEHIQTDPTHWINQCAAQYYQIQAIIAQ